MDLIERRGAAVADLIARVRAIEREHGVTRAMLERVKPLLIGLAQRRDLFPEDQFPPGSKTAGGMYRLNEEADLSYALYGSAERSGFRAPPHNHTTWATIAAVRGHEHNMLYRRTDDGGTPGQARLEPADEIAVVPGTAAALLPDDVHTIEIRAPGPALHLHLYGHSLEDLPRRVTFASTAGGAWRTFPPDPDIGQPHLSARALADLIEGGRAVVIDLRDEAAFRAGRIPGAIAAAGDPARALQSRGIAGTTPTVLAGETFRDGYAPGRALLHAGFCNVLVLDGGMPAWSAAGLALERG